MSIPAVIIGASGYVGGELLRLVAGHPEFELKAAVSDSSAGQPVGALFRHLGTALSGHSFVAHSEWLDHVDDNSDLALFSAAPHGASAAMLAEAIGACAARGINVHVVDSSADFRFAQKDAWETIYGASHGAPELLDSFVCALPEHVGNVDVPHVGHPGCFTTAATLATVPLMRSGLTEPEVFISGITGSTGSGKTPVAGTHHPERNTTVRPSTRLPSCTVPQVFVLIVSVTSGPPSVPPSAAADRQS